MRKYFNLRMNPLRRMQYMLICAALIVSCAAPERRETPGLSAKIIIDAVYHMPRKGDVHLYKIYIDSTPQGLRSFTYLPLDFAVDNPVARSYRPADLYRYVDHDLITAAGKERFFEALTDDAGRIAAYIVKDKYRQPAGVVRISNDISGRPVSQRYTDAYERELGAWSYAYDMEGRLTSYSRTLGAVRTEKTYTYRPSYDARYRNVMRYFTDAFISGYAYRGTIARMVINGPDGRQSGVFRYDDKRVETVFTDDAGKETASWFFSLEADGTISEIKQVTPELEILTVNTVSSGVITKTEVYHNGAMQYAVTFDYDGGSVTGEHLLTAIGAPIMDISTTISTKVNTAPVR
ncbi:MAG: hypothetical protein HZC28_00935 [Spirochaetes bacterium]|nr:hypothetical protein [Spirochaetota bacterium]